MINSVITTAFYDSKPYDREFLATAPAASRLQSVLHEFRLSRDTVATAAGAQAVCVFVNDRVDRVCLEQLATLGIRHVALRCAGFNNVDLTVAKALGIAVTRVPAYSPHAVAEHTVALLQTLNRKLHRAYNRVREHNFSLSGLVGFDLYGKTVGIVGTGKIGKITAEIFLGFGCRVVAHDPFPSTEWATAKGVKYLPLADLLPTSDIVSLHLPLTPQSQHLLNSTTLAQMKRGAYLLNTSRGKLIETKALIANLKTGQLGGVALDVYEEEEGVFFEDHSNEVMQDDALSRLLTFPNVLVTSHQAFFTAEALREIMRVTTENIIHGATDQAFLEGTRLA